MQFDPPLYPAVLLRRYKRFLADIETPEGERLTIHCPNTGSMLNCMQEGGPVWFSRHQDSRRKLPGTWELSETPQGRLACINTLRANAVIGEALQEGWIDELRGALTIRREVPYGTNSRADFSLTCPDGPVFVEVKSVTLGFGDTAVAAFPDARTARGLKHLRELIALTEQGIRAVQLFCVNLSGIEAVRAAGEIDPEYARTLHQAQMAGVEILAYGCDISPGGIRVARRIPVLLSPA